MVRDTDYRRGDVLQDVIAEAGRRRDATLPMDLPGVAETFHDELDLLATLQLRWHTRLAGRIEGELAEQPMDLPAAVVRAWRATAGSMPGVRGILDHYRAAPTSEAMARAMNVATTKEHQMLAVMAGQVSTMDRDRFGSEHGRALEESARAGLALPAAPGSCTLLGRLKAALAA